MTNSEKFPHKRMKGYINRQLNKISTNIRTKVVGQKWMNNQICILYLSQVFNSQVPYTVHLCGLTWEGLNWSGYRFYNKKV